MIITHGFWEHGPEQYWNRYAVIDRLARPTTAWELTPDGWHQHSDPERVRANITPATRPSTAVEQLVRQLAATWV